MNFLQKILPNQDTDSFEVPFLSIAVGAISKYVLGGTIFDILGHTFIFVGCLNIIYFLKRDKEEKFNFLISMLILGAMFIGVQIILIQVFRNWLDINTLLQ